MRHFLAPSGQPEMMRKLYANIRKGVRTVKGENHIEFIVHYPETEEMQRELAKRLAIVHAQTVMEKLATLSCPLDQKLQLIDAIIAKRRGEVRGGSKNKSRTR